MLTAKEQMEILLNFGTVVSQEKDFHKVLLSISDSARKLLQVDRCSIFLADLATNELYSVVAHGTGEIRFPIEKGIAGYAAQSKDIQVIVDAYNDFRFNKNIDLSTGYKTRSLIAIPLINKDDEIIGVFQALNKIGCNFSVTDVQALQLVAGYASSEIEKHQLYENIKNAQENTTKLTELANKDQLTELYNRRHFYDIVENFINLAKREKKELSVLMIDIDDFKHINDTYGHANGDKVIKSLSYILKENSRGSDIAARFGGEEFVVLLPNTSINAAFKVAEKLRSNIEKQVINIDKDTNISFTISIGVDGVNIKEEAYIDKALERADNSLYKAKANGKNLVIKPS